MRKHELAIALLGALTLFTGRASAWNSSGHMVVAKIAYDQLSDAEKAKVAAILKAHPHYARYLVRQKPRGVAEAEWVFLRAATWPDWVRGRGQPKDVSEYNHPPYHFVDKPFVNPAERDRFKEEDLRPKGDTILTALPEQVKRLKKGETAGDRAVALCWVLHLVGDIHQPLHCASFYSSTYDKGDRGGNSQLVRAGGHALPLHTYWDGLLGSSVRYPFVEVRATEIARDARYKRDKLKEELAKADFADWAEESFGLARDVAYLGGKLESQKTPHPRDDPDFRVPDLPAGYEARAKDCAGRQAALAGYRLADQVKAALGE